LERKDHEGRESEVPDTPPRKRPKAAHALLRGGGNRPWKAVSRTRFPREGGKGWVSRKSQLERNQLRKSGVRKGKRETWFGRPVPKKKKEASESELRKTKNKEIPWRQGKGTLVKDAIQVGPEERRLRRKKETEKAL